MTSAGEYSLTDGESSRHPAGDPGLPKSWSGPMRDQPRLVPARIGTAVQVHEPLHCQLALLTLAAGAGFRNTKSRDHLESQDRDGEAPLELTWKY